MSVYADICEYRGRMREGYGCTLYTGLRFCAKHSAGLMGGVSDDCTTLAIEGLTDSSVITPSPTPTPTPAPTPTPTPTPTPGATAPVLTKTTGTGVNPMLWYGDYTNLWADSDYIAMRFRQNGGAWTNDTDHLFTGADYWDMIDNTASFIWPIYAATSFAGGVSVDAQEGILRNAEIVISGDSWDVDYVGYYTGYWKQQRASLHITDLSEGGGSIRGANSLDARLAAVIAKKPRVYHIGIGRNDLGNTTLYPTWQDWGNDLLLHITDVLNIVPNCKVIVETLVAQQIAGQPAGNLEYNTRRASVNPWLRAQVGLGNIHAVIDFAADPVLGPDAAMTPAAAGPICISLDGLHLYERQGASSGHDLAYPIYAAAMDALIATVPIVPVWSNTITEVMANNISATKLASEMLSFGFGGGPVSMSAPIACQAGDKLLVFINAHFTATQTITALTTTTAGVTFTQIGTGTPASSNRAFAYWADVGSNTNINALAITASGAAYEMTVHVIAIRGAAAGAPAGGNTYFSDVSITAPVSIDIDNNIAFASGSIDVLFAGFNDAPSAVPFNITPTGGIKIDSVDDGANRTLGGAVYTKNVSAANVTIPGAGSDGYGYGFSNIRIINIVFGP